MLARVRLPRVRSIFYLAVAFPVVVGLLILLLGWRGIIRSKPLLPEFDPNDCVQTGEDAKLRILDSAEHWVRHRVEKPRMPESATNFWFYENGFLSKSRTYSTFECGSREDCLKAVESLGGLQRSELSTWQPSHYEAIMKGPGFHLRDLEPGRKLRANPWDVREIKEGLVYELVIPDFSLYYYAIDLDRKRVFYACEFGCFRGEEYQPTGK
jgi:hypothetical protein